MEFFLDNIIPILSIILPVWVTLYTVSKMIKARTHENHQPHLILEDVERVEKINKYNYYLTLFGKNFCAANKKFIEEDAIINNKEIISVNIVLTNIGYGVATNIKFYDLLTGKQVYGSQDSSFNKSQKLFTTFDIADKETKKVPAQIIGNILFEDGNINEEHNRILCVYKDLNNITDSFIMIINVKNNSFYDYSAYQPSSASYKRWVKENKKQYKKIIRQYSHS